MFRFDHLAQVYFLSGAFAVGATTLWRMLSASVKSVENIANFYHHLKTYWYNLAFPP